MAGCALRMLVFIFAAFLALIGALLYSDNLRVLAYGDWGIAAALLLFARRHQRRTWRDDPASYRQKSFLAEMGVPFRRGATKGELSDLIEEFKGRR